MKRVSLPETVHQPQATFDPKNSFLENVKVCGRNSRNGRVYTSEALGAAVSLYEGKHINLNHPLEATRPTSVRDRFGWLEGVRSTDDGLYADKLHFNPKHSYAEEFRWWAENRPSAIGLSHNAIGNAEEKDGVMTVHSIESVASVDLVADPATTQGLHEAMSNDAPKPEPTPGEAGYKEHIGAAVAAIMADESMSLPDKKKKIMALLKLTDDTAKPEEKPVEKPAEEKPKVEDFKLTVAANMKLLGEAMLPPNLVTPLFMEDLVNASTERAKALIEERKTLAKSQTYKLPESVAPGVVPEGNKKTRSTAEIAADLLN